MLRADVEAYLIDTCGAYLTLVGKDGTSHAGANASLSNPIASGLRRLGLVSSNQVNPTDGDVGMVDDIHVDRFFKACEFATLRSVWGNWTAFQKKVDDVETHGEQLANRLQARMAELETELAKPYGVGLNRPRLGTMTGGNPVPNQPVWMGYPRGDC